MKKKFAAVALAFAMLLGMMPVRVCAAALTEETMPVVYAAAETVPAAVQEREIVPLGDTPSGEAFDNGLFWALDSSGKLTISGAGAMEDHFSYNVGYEAPWYSHRESILSVEIAEGVTRIGGGVFSDCTNIQTVTIPESVTEIGSGAFDSCGSLESVVLPEGVQEIGDSAFHYCGNLWQITIPESVTYIGEDAFAWCFSLTSVAIPDGVTQILPDTFSGCHALEKVIFPDSITEIGSFAFYACLSLTELELPESLTEIGSHAFDACEYLTSLTFPEGVAVIGENAFLNCAALNHVEFRGSAPETEPDVFSTAAENLLIATHFGKTGWKDARKNWVLPEGFSWYDLDSAVTPEDFSFEQAEYTVEAGKSLALKTNADAYQLRTLDQWSAEPDGIIFLASNGTVTGLKPGITEVTLSSEDGTFSASCRVTVTEPTTPGSRELGLQGTVAENVSYNTYSTWDTTQTSFVTENANGTIDRIQLVRRNGIVVSRYSADFTLLSEQTIAPELELFGGFFGGEKYNFLLYGQSNPGESDDVEVLRIVKYSKDWLRLDACSIYGANTSIPFDAGTARMAEAKGKLYLHTCHEMYMTDDGLNHQANMTFVLDQETLKVEESFSDIMNIGWGYCSHSFSQRIRTNDSYVFRADHGDAYPRSIVITRAKIGERITEVSFLDMLEIQGEIGANSTGVSLGGLELSTDNCLVVGNSVDQSDAAAYRPYGVRNIFLSVADQELSHAEVIWLTKYSELEGVQVGTPQIIKTAADLFMVMWEEYYTQYGSYNTRMVMVTGDGTILSGILDSPMCVSDCDPIMTRDGLVTWFASDYYGDSVWYQINPQHLCLAKFRDVALTQYYFLPVSWAVNQGITTGMSETVFAPEDTCTRAQIVTFLWRAAGSPKPKAAENPFGDVPAGWYYDAVLWAVGEGITTGTSATTFSPDAPCTRAQVAAFLWRAQGETVSSSAGNPFADVLPDQYYYNAVLWAVENGVTTGTSATTFSPDAPCTRGQIVTFLYRAMG